MFPSFFLVVFSLFHGAVVKVHRMQKDKGLSRRREDQMTVMRPSNKITLFFWLFFLVLVVMGWGTGICRTDKAILKVVTDPGGAKLTVDTGEEGITPCTLEVPSGKRLLTIKKRAYIAAKVEVEVSSAEPTEVTVKLTPIPTT